MDKRFSIRTVIIIILAVWVALGVVNYFQVKDLQTPFLSWPSGVSNDGKITFLGAGYSFIIEGELTEEGALENVQKMDMYALGFRIISAEAK